MLDLSLFKFGDKEKEIDISKIRCTLGKLHTGEVTVEFMCEDVMVFKLSFHYDKEHKCGIINLLKPANENMDHIVAAVLNAFVIERLDIISMRSGFGDIGKAVDILSNHQFPDLIRIAITSMDKKSVAITKSLTKLQASFTEPKFSLVRLS